MREAKLRQDLNSQVKLQKADDINITQGLAAPKYMRRGSGGAHVTHQSAFPSLPHPSFSVSHVSFSDKCLGALDGLPPLHGKWVINSVVLLRIEVGCSCFVVCFVLLTLFFFFSPNLP